MFPFSKTSYSSSFHYRDFFFGRSRKHHKSGEGGGEEGAPPQPPGSVDATTSPKRHSRLRRSLSMKKLRSSFRRKESYVPPASKPHQWQMDEKLVRAGTCSFAVKVRQRALYTFCGVWLFKSVIWHSWRMYKMRTID